MFWLIEKAVITSMIRYIHVTQFFCSAKHSVASRANFSTLHNSKQAQFSYHGGFNDDERIVNRATLRGSFKNFDR